MSFAAQQGGGGGASTAETLQETYDASNPARIIVDGTNLGVEIRDNGTPIGASLFAVQSNDGLTDYFTVSAADIQTSLLITNPGGALAIGTPGGTPRASVTADNGVFSNGELEANGRIWADDGLTILANRSLIFSTSSGAQFQFPVAGQSLNLVLGSGHRTFVIGNSVTQDYDHGPQANPTQYIHSVIDPNTDNTQWVSFAHDQTNAVFNLGTGLFDFSGGEIGNVGNVDGRDVSADGATLDAHVADATIHFTQAAIDHTAILNIGTNSHATIDTHLASVANPHAVTLTQAYVSGGGVLSLNTTQNEFDIDGALLAAGSAGTAGPDYMTVTRGATNVLNTAYNATDFRATVYSGALNGMDISPDPALLPDRATISVGADKLTFLRQDRTINVSTPGGFFVWDSTLTFDNGLVNPTLGGFITLGGRVEFQTNTNPFGMGNAILHSATWAGMNGANLGPAFLFANNAVYQADGGATFMSQARIFFDNSTYNVANGGTLTTGAIGHVSVYAGVTVNTGATVTLRRGLFVPDVLGTGAVTTQVGVDIPDLTFATTSIGIRSAMGSGTFIEHTGTAPVEFGGSLFLGAGATIDVELLRGAANRLDLAAGDDFRMSSTGDIEFVNGTSRLFATIAGELQADVDQFGFNLDPSGANWIYGFNAPVTTITLGGDWANLLNTTGGNHTINAALSTFTQWTVNAPAGTIGSGSVVDAANMIIQTTVGVGTNRYGLLITADPAGGTLNHSLRVAGTSRFDASIQLASFTVAGVPSAAPAAQMIYVSDETGGAVPAFSDGTDWRRVTDRTIIA